MPRVAVLVFGAFSLFLTFSLVYGRRGAYSAYGGRMAFAVHMAVLTYFGISLIVFASVRGVSATALALGLIGLGLFDLVFGIVARRASARQRGDVAPRATADDS